MGGLQGNHKKESAHRHKSTRRNATRGDASAHVRRGAQGSGGGAARRALAAGVSGAEATVGGGSRGACGPARARGRRAPRRRLVTGPIALDVGHMELFHIFVRERLRRRDALVAL